MEIVEVKRIEPRAGRSKVWKYFGDLFVNEVKMNDRLVYCIPCLAAERSVHYKENTTTSALMYHLRHEHNIELVDINDSQKMIQHLLDSSYKPSDNGYARYVDRRLRESSVHQHLDPVYQQRFQTSHSPTLYEAF